MGAKHVAVHGRVQGVSFRAAAEQAASDIGVGGWVRNRDDGSVELHVEGDDESAVDRMVDWARSGPRHAEVTHVVVSDTDPTGHTTFTQT